MSPVTSIDRPRAMRRTPLAWVTAAAIGLALAPGRAEADTADRADVLDEIQARFPAAKKWFGMVATLQYDRAPSGSLVPRFDTLRSRFVLPRDPAGQMLGARLPPVASGVLEVWIEDSRGISVRMAEDGIAPVPVELLRGMVIYRGAVAGGDLLYKLTPTHVDEYIYFRTPPPVLRREFAFDTGSGVANLRQAGRLIEVVGRDGAAHLRLSAPVARAADGTRHVGTVRLEGTRVIEEIELAALPAPILVDPDWSTTGTMTVAHMSDETWRLPNNAVMAVGGCALASCPLGLATSACSQVLANTDLWDPGSELWSAGPALSTARYRYASAVLKTGELLVAGGCTATNCTAVTATAERYALAQGQWVPAGRLPSACGNTGAAALPGGDAIVPGGCDDAQCLAGVARYQAKTNGWVAVAPLSGPRGYATVTTLADGSVLVVGGCADVGCEQVLSDAEVYDPGKDAWRPAGSMNTPRAGHTATLLDDGTVLVAGGCSKQPCKAFTLATTEIWQADPKKGGVFTAAPRMGSPRHHHTATLLENGDVLMAGGADLTDLTKATGEVYLPKARRFVQVPRMMMSRAHHGAVRLASGKVLVGGGCNAATCLPWAEIFSPDGLPIDVPDGGTFDAGPEEDMAEAPPELGPPVQVTGGPHPKLYRTGVYGCGTDEEIDRPCPVAGWPAQDGDYQPSSRDFRSIGNGEVQDMVTGLIWQARADRGTFDLAGAIEHCSQLTTGTTTAGTWRVPDVTELVTLNLYGKTAPSTDHVFPDTVQTNHWSATPVAGMKPLQWTVTFAGGDVVQVLTKSDEGNTKLPVRCVRGESKMARAGSGHLRLAGPLTTTEHTVRDQANIVEWQRKDDGIRRSWRDALQYCSSLSLDDHTDWHLPNIYELLSLVEYASTDPVKIDPGFQEPKGDIYWSGTYYAGGTTSAWTVTFNGGVVNAVTNTGQAYVRCVRHMQLPSPSAPSAGCGCRIARVERGAGAPLGAALLAALLLGVARRRRRAGRGPEAPFNGTGR